MSKAQSLLDRQIEFTEHLVAGFPELGLRGWDLAGSCAVTGNATQENLCKPVTSGPKDHGSDGSLQWRLGRLTELQSWATTNFGDWRTLKAQAAFTLFETARDYPALDDELRKSMGGVKPEDVRKALDYKTEEFCFEFERPNKALAGLANRQKHAASVYYMIMSGQETPVERPKPKAPPIVTGGGAVVAGGSAAGGAAVVLQNGAVDTVSLVLFGIGLVIAAVVAYFMYRQKQAEPPAVRPIVLSPLDTLKEKLNNLIIAKAEAREAADAVKESVHEANDLLEAAGVTEHTEAPAIPIPST